MRDDENWRRKQFHSRARAGSLAFGPEGVGTNLEALEEVQGSKEEPRRPKLLEELECLSLFSLRQKETEEMKRGRGGKEERRGRRRGRDD